MIEINLPTEAAINLLNDQFVHEFKHQKKIKKVKPGISITELNGKQFKEILELALFDILILLPVTLITEESNLSSIIKKSVQGLSIKYNKAETLKFTEKDAEKLLIRIKKSFGNFSSSTTYQNN